jgi:hypothetical protein
MKHLYLCYPPTVLHVVPQQRVRCLPHPILERKSLWPEQIRLCSAFLLNDLVVEYLSTTTREIPAFEWVHFHVDKKWRLATLDAIHSCTDPAPLYEVLVVPVRRLTKTEEFDWRLKNLSATLNLE